MDKYPRNNRRYWIEIDKPGWVRAHLAWFEEGEWHIECTGEPMDKDEIVNFWAMEPIAHKDLCKRCERLP